MDVFLEKNLCSENFMDRESKNVEVSLFVLKNPPAFFKNLWLHFIHQGVDHFVQSMENKRQCRLFKLVPRNTILVDGKSQKLHFRMICLDHQIRSFQKN